MAKGKYLKRHNYIDATLEIIADIGVEKVSLRKVADHLGVSAMAMYKHFANKDELLSAVLDEFIAQSVIYPEADLPWDEWILYVGNRMFEALCGETSWLSILPSIRIGPTAIDVTEAFVTKLTDAGFSTDEAVEAFFAVIQTMMGAVALQSSMNSQSEDTSKSLDDLLKNYESSTETRTPDIMGSMMKALQKNQIEIALPILVDALRLKLQ